MRRPAVLALLATLTLPAAAGAGVQTIGSDLSATAALTQSHPRDWTAIPTAGFAAPVQGEVSAVDLKGIVRKPDNDAAYNGRYPEFHFLVAVNRPLGNGEYRFIVASQFLAYPFGKDASTITNYDIKSMDGAVCVKPGDVVSIATSGGFGSMEPRFGGFPDNYYGDGHPVQMFGRVPDKGYLLHEEAAVGTDSSDGFQTGDVITPSEQAGQELLMRVTIANGADGSSTCQTPEEQAATLPPRAGIPEQATRKKLSADNKATFDIACLSVRPCTGSIFIKHNEVPIGKAALSLAGQSQAAVAVPLNANGLRRLKQRKGRLKVTLNVLPKGGQPPKVTRGPFKLVR